MAIAADVLSPLVDVLAELYPDLASIRALAQTAGLTQGQISLDPKATNTWVFVLNEAEAQDRTPALLERAQSQYPVEKRLLAASQAYAAWAAAGRPAQPLLHGQPLPDQPAAPLQPRPVRRIPGWVWVTGGMVAVVLLVLGVLYALSRPDGDPTSTSAPLGLDSPVTSTPAPPTATPTGVTAAIATPAPPMDTPTGVTAATATPAPPTATPTGVTAAIATPAPPTATPIAFDWIEIPAGEFTMGSDPQQDSLASITEQLQHPEEVDTFWVARTEVTVAQFAAFVEATGYQTTAEKEGSSYTWTGSSWDFVEGANWRAPRGPGSSVDDKQDHPVTHISWDDAQAFSQWAGVRLPTEAEWEKACRGAEDRRIYPWGNNGPDKSRANYNMNVGDTTAVGRYPAGQSPYGLLDMSGNVWEWTQTKWRENYVPSAGSFEADNSPGGDAARVLRDGSFYSPARDVRCAVRFYFDPFIHTSSSGFRVVVSP